MTTDPAPVPSRRRGIALGLLAALLALGASAFAQAGGFRHKILVDPPSPRIGDRVLVSIVVEGLSAAGLEIQELAVGRGLRLESQAVRPIAGSRPGLRGSECRIELTALEAGQRAIARVTLKGREGSFRAGPIPIAVSSEGAAAPPPSGWAWKAPASIMRYEAFPIRLVPSEPVRDEEAATAAFGAPAGASIEPVGRLAWIGIALEPGELRLPEALISIGGRIVGKAPEATVAVRPLPRGPLEASRAIGAFTLRSVGSADAAAAGGRARARLVLEGRGNQPAVELPHPEARLDGRPLPAGALVSRRVDSIRPVAPEPDGSGGGYEGAAVLEVEAAPPRPGVLVISFPPIRVLGPDGREETLSVPGVRIEVEAASPAGRGAVRGGHGSYPGSAADLAAAAARIAALASNHAAGKAQGASATPRSIESSATPRSSGTSATGLAALPALLASGTAESRRRAVELLARTPAAVAGDAALVKASLLWEGGEQGMALALLYGTLRRNPAAPGFADAALACSGELGSGPPLLDALPPARPFAVAAIALLSVAAALFVASRFPKAGLKGEGSSEPIPPRRPLRAGPARRPVLGAAAALCLVLALLGAGLAVASAAERRARFAVLWTDGLLAVPSPLAEGRLRLARGATARVRSEAPGYLGVVLADGSSGWVQRESAYYY